jgi:hypothetical protein
MSQGASNPSKALTKTDTYSPASKLRQLRISSKPPAVKEKNHFSPFTVIILFFSARPMVFLLTGTSSSILACRSRSLSVHLECPSGTGPHAIWRIIASILPSILRFALSELAFLLYFITDSKPDSENSFDMLVTVARQTPAASETCSFVYSVPWASSRSRSSLPLFCMVLLTVLSLSIMLMSSTCSSLSETTFFLFLILAMLHLYCSVTHKNGKSQLKPKYHWDRILVYSVSYNKHVYVAPICRRAPATNGGSLCTCGPSVLQLRNITHTTNN